MKLCDTGSRNRFLILSHFTIYSCHLLAPTGALIVMVVYFQPACCYIKMATSYHQPQEHCFVDGWKRIFGRKTGRGRAVYESIQKVPMGETTEISVASQLSIRFSPNGPKWAVSAVFRALGGQNGTYTFWISPRRSDAAAEPGAPRPPFSHMIVGV